MAQNRRESPRIRIGLVWCALGVNVHVHFPLPLQLKLFRLFMKHLVSSKVGAQREVEASWLIHGFPKEFQANEKLACRKQNVHSLSLLPYSRPIRSLLLLFWQPQILPYLQLRGLECDGTVRWSGVDVDCFHGSWLVTVSVVKDK